MTQGKSERKHLAIAAKGFMACTAAVSYGKGRGLQEKVYSSWSGL